MAGTFEIYRDKADKYRFRLKAGDGEIILSSQGYDGRSGCRNGVDSVRRNANDPKRFVKSRSESGTFSFTLLSSNGQVIGTSQTYSSESGRDNGIRSVGRSAPDATVVDQT